jgi:hypothetical protein
VGRHSPLRAQQREQHRANEVKKLKANDVWSFFKKDEHGQQACLFCKYVLSSLVFGTVAHNLPRQKQAIDPTFVVQTYGPKTGTTVLRAHLCNEHMGHWVEGCDKFKIPINAKLFQGRVDEYRKQNGGSQARQEDPTLPTRAYSREAFIDAIVEWIIADDQVCVHSELDWVSTINSFNYCSPLMLSKAPSYELYFACCAKICVIQTSLDGPTFEPVLLRCGTNM